MGYELDASMMKWAEKRMQQLEGVQAGTMEAMDSLARIPKLLEDTASKAKDQPEGDMLLSFAMDIRRLVTMLVEDFEDWEKDRKALVEAFDRYRGNGGNENDS